MERWKDIPGYEGQYQVSNQGNVRSLDRTIWCKTHYRKYKGYPLAPGKFTKQGHLSIPLGKKSHGRCVHELVMLAFVGPRPLKSDICHVNGNASDNRLCNLRYDTRSENNKDVARHGRRKIPARLIPQIHSREHTGVYWAKRLLVSQSLISAIRNKRLYSHV